MASYSFLTIWKLDAPIEAVWNAIADAARYPEWWKYVASVERISPGDERGVGVVGRTTWRTALPYTLSFEGRITRVEPPHLLEGVTTGELEGTGRWELSEDANGTTVRYTWKVRTTRPWMNLVAPLLRPAFVWNHDVLMTEGGEALARLLGARLLQNESGDVARTGRPHTAPLLGGMLLGAGVAVCVRLALRR